MKSLNRMVAVAAAVSIGATASAGEKLRTSENPVDATDSASNPEVGLPRKRGASQARRVAACAAALYVLSVEAEKSYRAALTPPIVAVKPVSLPMENASARRALNKLELALVEAPDDDPMNRAASRFAGAAEALLLRSREPARRAGDDESVQTHPCRPCSPPTNFSSTRLLSCDSSFKRRYTPRDCCRQCALAPLETPTSYSSTTSGGGESVERAGRRDRGADEAVLPRRNPRSLTGSGSTSQSARHSSQGQALVGSVLLGRFHAARGLELTATRRVRHVQMLAETFRIQFVVGRA